MSRLLRNPDWSLSEAPGHSKLWKIFGLSRASWLVMPRSLMHEMPDEWQAKMAEVMDEFFSTYSETPRIDYEVKIKSNGRYVKMPDWVDYRHPDVETIKSFKGDGK